MSKRRKIATVFLLTVMVGVGLITYPIDFALFSRQFWEWASAILGGTILIANIIFQEEQLELFGRFSIENFNNAPVFGILAIPFIISLIAAGILSIREFLL